MTDYEIRKLTEIRNLNVEMMQRWTRPPLIAVAHASSEYALIMHQQCLIDVLLEPDETGPVLIKPALIIP